MNLNKFLPVAMALALTAGNAYAVSPNADVACPVDTPYADSYGNPMTFEEKFGPGTEERLRCLDVRHDVKVVMQVNQFMVGSKPYAFGNLTNLLKDYEITNGMDSRDYEVAVVVHSGGYPFVLDPDAAVAHPDAAKNVYKTLIESFIAKGVKIYLCANTANSKGIRTEHLIPGVEYVTSGVGAIVDFQQKGYSYLQP